MLSQIILLDHIFHELYRGGTALVIWCSYFMFEMKSKSVTIAFKRWFSKAYFTKLMVPALWLGENTST
jgi:hypothetical protein